MVACSLCLHRWLIQCLQIFDHAQLESICGVQGLQHVVTATWYFVPVNFVSSMFPLSASLGKCVST